MPVRGTPGLGPGTSSAFLTHRVAMHPVWPIGARPFASGGDEERTPGPARASGVALLARVGARPPLRERGLPPGVDLPGPRPGPPMGRLGHRRWERRGSAAAAPGSAPPVGGVGERTVRRCQPRRGGVLSRPTGATGRPGPGTLAALATAQWRPRGRRESGRAGTTDEARGTIERATVRPRPRRRGSGQARWRPRLFLVRPSTAFRAGSPRAGVGWWAGLGWVGQGALDRRCV